MNTYNISVLGGELNNCIFAEFSIQAKTRLDAEGLGFEYYKNNYCHSPDSLWLLKIEAELSESGVEG